MAPFLDGITAARTRWDRLQDLLKHAAESNPSQSIIIYPLGNTTTPVNLPYSDLYIEATKKSQILKGLTGFQEGSPVLLHLTDHHDMILWFWATMLANGLPVPSPPLSNDAVHRRKHIEALSELLNSPLCITRSSSIEELGISGTLKLHSIESVQKHAVSSINSQHCDQRHSSSHTDLAMLMLTSGSSGDAKAVKLSHRQIIAAISGKASVRDLPRDKPLLNWIGLDHVASLVEIHIQALYLGVGQIHVHAADIISQPQTFLDLLSLHQVSRTFAPNFFLSKLMSAFATGDHNSNRSAWDFRYLTDIVSGGEANDLHTCKALANMLVLHGAPHNCITVGFGMTETCAGAIYNTRCTDEAVNNDRPFAAMGKCMDGIDMRVTKFAQDDSNSVLLASAGESGSLQIRGNVVFDGYYGNEKAGADAFTHDGWFKTGDTGMIDSTGNLHLVGRTKEVININGIKFLATDLQTSMEAAVGPRVVRLVTFASRIGHTEQVAVAYTAKQWPVALDDVIYIDNAISNACVLSTGSKPLIFGIPDQATLPMSTLGKISRAKMGSLLEGGSFAEYIQHHHLAVSRYQQENFTLPSSKAEIQLIDDFAEVLGIKQEDIGTSTPIYDLGFSSVDLIRLKRKVDLRLNITIPLAVFMKNPTARLLASALKKLDPAGIETHQETDSANSYDPVVVFRPTGSKTPLWCIHPGVGEVLIFVGLSNHLADDDRPIFALRARGFDDGHPGFRSITEAVANYKAAIIQRQPEGPYAIAGYSYGGMLAFEIAKLLEQEEAGSVQFLASFNLPPHIKTRMGYLNFNVCLLHLSYFLGLVSEEYAESVEDEFWRHPNAMNELLKVADRKRMEELGLTTDSLSHWADITFGLQSMAKDYEPKGKVKVLDVFHAIPLKGVAKSQEDWLENHLSKWKDFSESEPIFHKVSGAHYTMIGPDHIETFSRRLKNVLKSRGL